MKFRPCIDLHQGKVKQIVGGSLNDEERPDTNFESGKSSAYYAELYRQDNLLGGHVIMLGPGNEKAAKDALANYPGGLQIGGGINADSASSWIEAGAAQVILTSYIFNDGEVKLDRLEKICDLVGRDNLVLDLSCRQKNGKYYIVTDRWQKFTNCEVNAESLKFFAKYACEFLIHAVDVEGKQAGIDLDLLQIMAKSPLVATYAGGIHSFDDLETIKKTGDGKVDFTIGSALDIFGGKMKYEDVLKWSEKINE